MMASDAGQSGGGYAQDVSVLAATTFQFIHNPVEKGSHRP